ncbi:hypothetical protein Dfri01_47450 [Dyadobacter frigoris]|uniref:hypothetical protein n=1 Tax=Dyadobacter frigoris TaxID=2576211 RepID=UPI0024A4E77F|nr:hypothetical protein [Dyadobacter frigoris]GLU55284.1 hypothetical protein Dfri01_47450 [Dyadobacter frigoris]
MNHAKESIEILPADFTNALNSGNREDIAAFYTEDALFMPPGNVSLFKSTLSKNTSREHFKKVNFHIDYRVKDNRSLPHMNSWKAIQPVERS